FLFTDIEGATRLLKQLGEQYNEVLAQHRRILREAAESRAGREVDTQGDSFFFAFERANAALGAAVIAQRALAAHDWPEGAEIRVRMGLQRESARSAGGGASGSGCIARRASEARRTVVRCCSRVRPVSWSRTRSEASPCASSAHTGSRTSIAPSGCTSS